MKILPQKNKHTKTITYFLILFSLLITTTQKITEEEIKDICSKADSYVVSFFDSDPQIPEKYKDFEPKQQYKIKDNNTLDVILLNKDSVKKYKENKFKTEDALIFAINIIFFIITIIIFLIFNIHFLCRAYTFQRIEQKIGKFAIFLKMAPFAWINYLAFKKEKRDNLIKDYNENRLPKIPKNCKIVLIVISMIFLVGLTVLSLINNITYNKNEKSIYNVSCALLKFFYELENKTDKNKNFIGLEKVMSYFNYTEENENILIEKYSKNYFNSYNNTFNLVSKWNNYINELNERLSLNDKNEFTVKSYPSDLDYNGTDYENLSHFYQLTVIYNYHPSTDERKTLYNIDNVLKNNYEIFSDVIRKINTTNQILSEVKKNDEELVKKIYKKIGEIIDIYATKFENEYISNNGKIEIKNNLANLLMPDIIFLLVNCLSLIISVLVILYFLGIKYMNDKLIFVVIFYNVLFILTILALYNNKNSHEIKKEIALIDDISQVIVFLLDDSNLYYNKKLKDTNNDINFEIIDESNVKINIFYYINHIINNNGNISGIYNFKYENFKINELEGIYTKLNNIINDKTNIINQNKTSQSNVNIQNYITQLNTLLKSGIIGNTYFQDLTGTGYRGTGVENAKNYLTQVNMKTRYQYRVDFSIIDILCDETWDVVNTNFENYKYKNRKYVLDCTYCVNFCNMYGVVPPPLLNFYEYELDEILYRYNFLDIGDPYTPIYNSMAYQFTALDLLIRRNNTALTQVKKLVEINNYIKDLELEIYDSLKNTTIIGGNIMDYFENIIQEYTTGNDFYSFLNFDFIRNDTLFLLAEVQSSLVENINNYCLYHLLATVICILVNFYFVVSYTLISYEIPLPKEKSKEIINIDKIKEQIKVMVKDKKMKQEQKTGQNLNNGNIVNEGNNVTIYQGGKIVNKTNVKPVYNTLFCSGEKPLNDKDVSNVNEKIRNSPLLGLNKFFAQNQNNDKSDDKLEAIAEEKDENFMNNNNLCDQSKVNILKEDIIKVKKK